MTKLELQNIVNTNPEKEVRKQDLHGSDFSGMNLSGVDFRRCNLNNVNFSGCNLTNAILVLADVTGANFSGATLDGCDFELVKNADKATFIGAIYGGKSIKKPAIVDTVGKYQRLVTDAFIQIGCLKGDDQYWKTMDDVKLAAEVDKVNPSEKADAKAWKDLNLTKTIKDHDDMKKEKP